MGNAGGMDLGETRIGKKRAFFVGAIGRRDVAAARVGREIKNISVTAGREHDRIGCDVVDPTGAQISSDASLGMSFDNYDVEHFGLMKHLHDAGGDLQAACLITAKQMLLDGL